MNMTRGRKYRYFKLTRDDTPLGEPSGLIRVADDETRYQRFRANGSWFSDPDLARYFFRPGRDLHPISVEEASILEERIRDRRRR